MPFYNIIITYKVSRYMYFTLLVFNYYKQYRSAIFEQNN